MKELYDNRIKEIDEQLKTPIRFRITNKDYKDVFIEFSPETTLSDFYERTRKLIMELKTEEEEEPWFLEGNIFFKSNQMQTIIGQKSLKKR